jgi:hypothetical protein
MLERKSTNSEGKPGMTETKTLDLSAWTIEFNRTAIGWSWGATHSDGREAGPVNPLDPGIYAKKENAEVAAMRAIEAEEGNERTEKLNGADLFARIQDRQET